ncbi:MAG: hypothetical protein F6K14_34575 [Symploca sp. SIO2C1]|nr:hypothetical protein [Symploca sp. SIO2C1]
MLNVISIFAKSIGATDLPRGTQLIPEIIQVKRCFHDSDILYSCAIAFKLAHLWQLQAIDIANQLVTTLGEKFYCCAQGICLNFNVQVVSSGWIYFRLKEESLANWLQHLISPGDGEIGRWEDGEMGGWRDGEIGRWRDGGIGRWGDGEIGRTTPTTENFFTLQYTHARCCSLLRLAHKQGLIKVSGQQTILNFPNPIPWLKEAQGLEGEVLQLRLVHPAERRLIAQIIDVQDSLSNQTQLQGKKLARDLSKAFEQFYSSCRIWGEVKSQTPKLAQARLGLVAVTQVLLRSLLQEHLGVVAPLEL